MLFLEKPRPNNPRLVFEFLAKGGEVGGAVRPAPNTEFPFTVEKHKPQGFLKKIKNRSERRRDQQHGCSRSTFTGRVRVEEIHRRSGYGVEHFIVQRHRTGHGNGHERVRPDDDRHHQQQCKNGENRVTDLP